MSLIVAAVKGESSVNWQIYNAYSKDLNNYIKYLQINLEDKKKKKKVRIIMRRHASSTGYSKIS